MMTGERGRNIMSARDQLSRRKILRLTAGMGLGAALAACGNTQPTAPKIGGAGSTGGSQATAAPAAGTKPSESKPAAGATSAPAAKSAGSAKSAGGPVYVLVDKTWADIGMREATELYNKSAGTEITVEETAQGWDTKVLAQIRDQNLRWSGHGYAAFFDSYKYIKAGLVEPLDDYLKASKVGWAMKQKESYFTPRIYEALLFEGKQYYIPMKANVHLAGWRQDYLEQAGYETLPKTWDEIDQMLPKMKSALEKDEVIPFAIQRELFRAVGTTFTTFIENPVDDQGVLKFESPEFIAVIEMFQKWIQAGLARFDVTGDSYDAWQKGKFALSLGSHSWVRTGRQVWADKVKGGRPPKANADAPDRTWVHIDSAFVFPGAPNPQEAVDWALSILGPEGAPAERWWTGVVTFSGQPVFQSMIDKALKNNQQLSEVADIMGVVPNSYIINIPVAGNYALMEAKMLPHLDRCFKGEVTAKEAMAATRKDFDAELAKQKA
jgi:ABC-type glycerol-3-phosphate transport system substrate-binding protein